MYRNQKKQKLGFLKQSKSHNIFLHTISNQGELYLNNLYYNTLLIQQIQQYPKTLQFSVTYKGQNFQVTEGGKVVEQTGGNSYQYCLCEQAIQKTGKILFAFQILSLTSSMYIGIGFRDIIQKNNYQSAGVGYGSHMISQHGYTYSHHNKDISSKQLSFTYTTNDIIIMEVSIEHKYIKWTRSNNPLAKVQMEIDTSISQELYPCVLIYQSSKVKILDNIIFYRYLQYYSQFQRNQMWCFMLKTIHFIQIQFYNFNKKLFKFLNIKIGENRKTFQNINVIYLDSQNFCNQVEKIFQTLQKLLKNVNSYTIQYIQSVWLFDQMIIILIKLLIKVHSQPTRNISLAVVYIYFQLPYLIYCLFNQKKESLIDLIILII
ncbi:unnamed protein product [Paramecium primaurelia]|uniref:Uncharacterized protein n=1 Tax=Paramecium primaurelia TaxID=5886 RepID=A0A8S1N3I6_PARPR|nr:unnamed protein product [Paramecium primaurelia]